MKIDLYTKIVLTVIAGSLLIISTNQSSIIKSALAQLSRSDISYCWDGATVNRINDDKWKIKTYC